MPLSLSVFVQTRRLHLLVIASTLMHPSWSALVQAPMPPLWNHHSLPESWHHPHSPPVHHHVAARRDQQINGVSRPARYRPVAATDRSAAGDLPDDRPRLPSRPELLTRSGRTSPVKRSGRTSPVKQILRQHSVDGLKQASRLDGAQTPPRIPANKPIQRSALTLGFDRNAPTPTTNTPHIPPAIPAPRRSMDKKTRDATTCRSERPFP